uniref:Uncharacterized protein n=1 Tax=Siphoviridae sp. ctXZx16 TaxID=2826371 RepID=A0A8S5ML44_9CAUD|nr:MAG TPA: hypothetical protein [Siphoviridae sp. ctXZx16]
MGVLIQHMSHSDVTYFKILQYYCHNGEYKNERI